MGDTKKTTLHVKLTGDILARSKSTAAIAGITLQALVQQCLESGIAAIEKQTKKKVA